MKPPTDKQLELLVKVIVCCLHEYQSDSDVARMKVKLIIILTTEYTLTQRCLNIKCIHF